MSYEWMARSGCDMCAAMTGIYEEAPPRPHHRCDCEIMELDWEQGECWVEMLDSEVDMGVDPWVYRAWFKAHVQCPNGQEYSETFAVERDFDLLVLGTPDDPASPTEDEWWLQHDWQHDITEALHDAYASLQLNCSVWVDPTP